VKSCGKLTGTLLSAGRRRVFVRVRLVLMGEMCSGESSVSAKLLLGSVSTVFLDARICGIRFSSSRLSYKIGRLLY
jgi:hypothetical protein